MAEEARIGILVVAYNAASTLQQVLDRIPESFRPRITQVLVSDDASHDSTYLIGLGYQQIDPRLPLTVVRQESNLGYGGNQKVGYRWAIDHDLDIVVLLHGDGQYAPEFLPEMVAPLEHRDGDAVFGSRMLDRGAARQGGMPLYKFVGNKVLTAFENKVMGSALSEWHSGYRAYRVDALREIPFESNSDDFDFDTEIIVELLEAGKRIVEIPVPTFYGDEISHVNGMKYAWDSAVDVVRYRLHRMGFGSGETAFSHGDYEYKASADSSHGLVASLIARRKPGRLLDLGCADGAVTAPLRDLGWEVTGVDLDEAADVRERLDHFVKADLDEGLPPEVGRDFDVVLAADVFEHLREPERLLANLRALLAPNGVVVACIPNFAHWYPRLRVAAGRFDYDQRGILDRGHLRFFTRRSFGTLAHRAGFSIERIRSTGLPFDALARGNRRGASRPGGPKPSLASRLDRMSVDMWPTLFAFQFVFELNPTQDGEKDDGRVVRRARTN